MIRTRLAARRAAGDRGAVLVEFAIVMPVLFGLMFTLAHFALTELGNTVGSNAAREGARVGILQYVDADDTSSANHAAIFAAVQAKLQGLLNGAPVVDVKCVEADGTTLVNGTGTCASSAVTIGSDLIRVRVTWSHISVSPFSSGTNTDSATMKIVGTPPAGGLGTTPECTLSSPSVTPAAVNEVGGVIDSSLVFRVTVSSTACGVPLITLPAESGALPSQSMTLESPSVYRFDYSNATSGQAWTPGSKTAQFQALSGTASAAVLLTVTTTSSCVLGITTADPVIVNINGSGKVQDAVTITVTRNDIAACGVPTITLPNPPSPYTTALDMGCSGPTCTFTIPKNEDGWSAMTGALVTINATGATTSVHMNVS